MRDDSGAGTAIWFDPGVPRAHAPAGSVAAAAAPPVRAGRGLELAVREHEVLAEAGEGLHTSGMVAVYDASRRSRRVSCASSVEQHLPRSDAIADPLPVGVRLGRRLPLRRDAIAALHAPDSPADAKDRERPPGLRGAPAAAGGAGAPGRGARRQPAARSRFGRPGELLQRYQRPRAPVHAHDRAEAQASDRHRPRSRTAAGRMHRLLLGGVGSGKTVVAQCRACCAPRERGRQAALLAPTEVLVQAARGRRAARPAGARSASSSACHRRSAPAEPDARLSASPRRSGARRWARTRYSSPASSSRSLPADRRRRAAPLRRRAARGAPREAMAQHALHMTATPIPRSLALSLYGDLDLTELRRLPRRPAADTSRRVRRRRRSGPIATSG